MQKLVILIKQMSNPQISQQRATKPKSSAYQALFKQPFSSPKNVPFQQIFQMMKKDTQQAAKNCFTKNTNRLSEKLRENQRNLFLQNQNNRVQGQFSKKAVAGKIQRDFDDEFQKKKLRAVSSKKFDCINKKKSSKRGKKFTQNLLEYVKLNEGGSSNSKKSTDNSNSSEIEKIKSENELISQYIKAEERRIKLLEKQIKEQNKKHQSEKQLYKLNIDKLKKKVCQDQAPTLKEIDEIRESFLSENEDHSDYDTLSIDSH